MELLLFIGFIVNSVIMAYVLLHAGNPNPCKYARVDPDAHYVNFHCQSISQIPPEELTEWLERHKSFEIISFANVGPYVLIVYK